MSPNAISIHLMLLFISTTDRKLTGSVNFNTSHVTVYLAPCHCESLSFCPFQYISCYCLSTTFTSNNGEDVGFQYISCYCLSVVRNHTAIASFISIHLMLLFINPARQQTQKRQDFNTSHVTVYRLTRKQSRKTNRFQYISCYCLSRCQKNMIQYSLISIHLMLLFIDCIADENPSSLAFQYISCYCLSHCHNLFFCHFRISIHLMLLFIIMNTFEAECEFDFNTSHVTVYQLCYHKPFCIRCISIHLMLLFIEKRIEFNSKYKNFNTSHVTVYLLELLL